MGNVIERGSTLGGGTHIEIEYAPPFGGIDSSAPAPYIKKGFFVELQNFTVRNQALTASSFTPLNPNTGTFPGVGQPNRIVGAGNVNNQFFYVMSDNKSPATHTFWSWNGLDNAFPPILIASVSAGTFGDFQSFTYKNINKVAYISGAGLSQIYKLDMTSITAPLLTVLTTYLGAAYLGEINGRLVAANVWKSNVNYPWQFAWSAAGQQYGIWTPLDTVTSLVTGAGYNNLPDVEDVITGMIFSGPTVYVLRSQGITEVTPLASGIQPFDFNHMWASHFGVGCSYPLTVAQYGGIGCFLSEGDIYKIGTGGLQPITKDIKAVLYTKLVAANLNLVGSTSKVMSVMIPLLIDNTPAVCYIIGVFNTYAVTADFFIYDFDQGIWSHIIYPLNLTNTNLNNFFLLATTSNVLYLSKYLNAQIFLIEQVSNLAGGFLAPQVSLIQNPAINSSVIGSQIICPPEEIALGRDVTIDGIIAYCKGTIGEVITFTVNGVNYSPVTISSTSYQYYKLPSIANPYTGTSPQLTIVYNGPSNISIAKVSLFGTINVTQRPI